LQGMTKEEAKDYNFSDKERLTWVKLANSKINYGPPKEDTWLRRGENGILRGAIVSPDQVADEQETMRNKSRSKKQQNKSVV
jgi:hypothetical protein